MSTPHAVAHKSIGVCLSKSRLSSKATPAASKVERRDLTDLPEMVYTGKPSAGCENCRKAKKRCDQELPACGRCVRLGKACGGYRDLTDLIFKNETANVTRRASSQSETSQSAASSSTATTRNPSPEKESRARKFFFSQFVTASHLSFLEGVSADDFLSKPILACAMAAIANRENDTRARETARRYYVEAITATNAALRHPRKVKEDHTIVAVSLLAVFERITWEQKTSITSWRHHVQGSAQVLQLRGRGQIRTKTGALLFRELRDNLILNALTTELEVPEFVVQWTQALDFDPLYTPGDDLTVLAARVASFKAAFLQGSETDEELATIAETLERDLLSWSESTLAAGSVCSFHNVRDLDSPHSWNGTRHEYGIPQAHRYWNKWRCLRILLSRAQEALWRRSWPSLAGPSYRIPDAEHHRSFRNRMASDICIAIAYTFGNDPSAEPERGAVSAGYQSVMPLCVAGTCLLEQLADPISTPGGSRMILVDEPLHTDLFNQTSTQLAWVIERMDYIANKVGVKWAAAMNKFLKGETKIYYDIGRSAVVRTQDLESTMLEDILDLESIMRLSDVEEP